MEAEAGGGGGGGVAVDFLKSPSLLISGSGGGPVSSRSAHMATGHFPYVPLDCGRVFS